MENIFKKANILTYQGIQYVRLDEAIDISNKNLNSGEVKLSNLPTDLDIDNEGNVNPTLDRSHERIAFKKGAIWMRDQFKSIQGDKEGDISIKPVKELRKGDIFLWQSGRYGTYEIHTFHSDAGYGAKTYTGYNEKDGSSEIVNYSGICGVLFIKQTVN